MGTLPFLVFAGLFLLAPVVLLAAGSIHDAHGELTLQNYGDLVRPDIVLAFRTTIEISLVTAVAGAILGFLIAYAIILAGLPGWLRRPSSRSRGWPPTSPACPSPWHSSSRSVSSAS